MRARAEGAALRRVVAEAQTIGARPIDFRRVLGMARRAVPALQVPDGAPDVRPLILKALAGWDAELRERGRFRETARTLAELEHLAQCLVSGRVLPLDGAADESSPPGR